MPSSVPHIWPSLHLNCCKSGKVAFVCNCKSGSVWDRMGQEMPYINMGMGCSLLRRRPTFCCAKMRDTSSANTLHQKLWRLYYSSILQLMEGKLGKHGSRIIQFVLILPLWPSAQSALLAWHTSSNVFMYEVKMPSQCTERLWDVLVSAIILGKLANQAELPEQCVYMAELPNQSQ